MEQLTWFECSMLNKGQEVVFVDAYYNAPQGAKGTVRENWLNELSCFMAVDIEESDEPVILGTHLNPGCDVHCPAEEREPAAQEWFEPSPLMAVKEVMSGLGMSTRARCD